MERCTDKEEKEMILKLMEFYMVISMSLFPVLIMLVIQLLKDLKEQDEHIAQGRGTKIR